MTGQTVKWRLAAIAGATRETRTKYPRAYSGENSSDSGYCFKGGSTLIRPKPAEAQKTPEDAQLASMTGMDVNWSVEGGEPPNEHASANARLTLTAVTVNELEPTYVTASAEGGIAICFRATGVFTEIECFNSGEIWGMIAEDSKDPVVWQIEGSLPSLTEALTKISSALRIHA